MNYIKTKIILGIALIIITVIVFFTSVFNRRHDRYVLFFKNSITSKINTEIRYIPTQNIQAPEVSFFEELMLGPVNHQCYSFIPQGVKLLSCFVKEDVLYADFPKNFINNITEPFDSEDIKGLLQKNIFTNCKNLKAVNIFVEGRHIYEILKK